MKKFALVLLLSVIVLSSVCAGALSFSLTAGYEHQSCKDRDNASNGLGFTAGVRGPLNEYLDFFGTGSLRIKGDFKYANTKYKNSVYGYKLHAGVIYNIPLRSDTLKTGLGLSLVFARSLGSEGSGDSKIQYGFSNLGIGIHATGSYSFTPHFLLVGEVNPDVYFINWNTEKKNSTTTSNRLGKIGFGFSLKLGFAYAL